MKTFLMAKSLVLLSALNSSAALAHAGHGASESLHGVLHAEHLLGLLLVAGVAYLLTRSKG